MANEDVTVRVKFGTLRGKVVPSENGSHFFSFQGVPYAKPPVGSLRFKPAQPVDQWEGTRDALKEGPPCPQVDYILLLPYRGDEDCLYLNIYTPHLPKENEKLKIPVMVWIHGGGFEVGSGEANVFGPHYLVNEGVILVTINYRLGILGFLSLDDEFESVNLGLKDQVVALRWIQENIEIFGGDRNNVTIFGESAGGASVHFHMLSPMSKGLFHKGIMESGCALNEPAIARNPKELAFVIGKELGCSSTSTKELLKFFEGVPASDLVKTYFSKKQQWRFGPVPENKFTNEEEIFLPRHPKELMNEKKFQHIPCIIGVNSQEGIFSTSITGILKNPTLLRNIGENFDTIVPYHMDLKRSNSEAANEIKNFYFNNRNLSEASLNEYINFSSDVFMKDIDKTVMILAEKTFPIYYYCFDFIGNMNIFKNFVQATDCAGASHMDELGYIFTTTFFSTPKAEPESPEWITLRRMVRMWTDFAKSGNPTPLCDDIISVRWSPYTSENPECLNITNTLCMQKYKFKDCIDFWNNL